MLIREYVLIREVRLITREYGISGFCTLYMYVTSWPSPHLRVYDEQAKVSVTVKVTVNSFINN